MQDRTVLIFCEVYRQPVADAASFPGWRYEGLQGRREGEQVAPLVAPELAVRIAEFLPTR